MLYFKIATKNFDMVVEQVVDESPPDYADKSWTSRNYFESMAEAEAIALAANDWATIFSKEDRYIATDAGSSTSPRYDVIVAPKVGDKVSRYFNGDLYPDGVIEHISSSLRKIRTSTGTTFWRRKQTGSWVAGDTWSMCGGHEYKQNPSF